MSSSPQPSASETNVFSVRIVSLDYYMAPPIPDIDICYSSFQGGDVKEVPVIRIYGSTLAGQKTCLHVHKTLPYLYLPCAEIGLQTTDKGDAYLHAIEKALSVKSSAGSKRQHVHGCSIVRAKRFYGYHASEELFVKIYLYYPNDLARAAALLLGGAILERSIQPYESHIPFLLQFLVDYNLYGMSHLHTSRIKFRHPIPDDFIPSPFRYKKQNVHGGELPSIKSQADSNRDRTESPMIWLSSTVPRGWSWSISPPGNDRPEDKTIQLVKRQSVCELEGDCCVDDILNQISKICTSLSQTRPDTKVVQSLVPIWEEEYERTGIQETVKFSDSSKPLPESILRSFLHGFEYETSFSKLHIEAQTPFSGVVASDLEENSVQDARSSSNLINSLAYAHGGSVSSEEPPPEEDNVIKLSERIDSLSGPASIKKLSNEMIKVAFSKANDIEDVRLLNWLASSQALDDINSDDELGREVLLSPLLPTKTYEKALEKAHLDYESASQKECQDILDSIEEIKFEGLKDETASSTESELTGVPSDAVIPQIDGSSDDQVRQESKDTITKFDGKKKRNKLLWGSLPFSIKQKELEGSQSSSADSREAGTDEMKQDIDCNLSGNKVDKNHDPSMFNVELETSGSEVGKELSGSSLRDLMRRKRCLHTEISEYDRHIAEAVEVKGSEMAPSLGKIAPESDSLHGRIVSATFMPTACSGIDRPSDYQPQMYNKLASSDLLIENLDYSDSPSDREKTTYFGGLLSFKTKRPPLSNSTGSAEYRQLPLRICTDELKSGFVQSSSKHLTCDLQSCKNVGLSILECDMQQNNCVDDELNYSLPSGSCNGHDAPAESSSFRGPNFNYNSNKDCDISIEVLPNADFDDHQKANPVLSPDGLQTQMYEQKLKTCSTGCHHTSSRDTTKINDPLEYIEMTFSRKAPTIDQMIGISEDVPWMASHIENNDDSKNILKSNFVSNESERQHLHGIPPFFLGNFGEGIGSHYKHVLNAPDFHQEDVMGVPIHYQNDGSPLYLLTYAVSPPPLDSVCCWVSELDQHGNVNYDTGISKENCNLGCLEHSSKKNICLLNTTEGSGRDISEIVSFQPEIRETRIDHGCQTSSQSACVIVAKPVLDQLGNEQNVKPIIESNMSDTAKLSKESSVAFLDSDGNEPSNNWYDISQISGPDRRSKLTPLSQIGFRDPAIMGGGQQLTLLSVEVQAESRGDLRPDPRFDAINIVTLVIQDDANHDSEVYVLLRDSNLKSSGSAVGISGCKLVTLLEERCLFDYLTEIICSVDPDILMGWEVQGSSLGFLAERAAQLGLRFLKNISRTPMSDSSRHAKASADSEKRIDNLLPEAPITNSTVYEDALIEDEWGRTHACGIHVGGRVVLNLWRIMRAEVKLNMYTLESVADEVLRRKIPSIPCRVLNHWFSDGTRRARFRCIEYSIERAKLNLAIAFQLDLINRTSELARVFGIDFFSVLSRGSQYRVESMMLRLAHTQNYLAISPGNQQVALQPAMECLPLIMEPLSGFYDDPVVVLDFQSLYPSMIIAYNLCFCTCLGKIMPSKPNILGVSSYFPDKQVFVDLNQQILLCPNGVMYVPSKTRRGVLPRLLEEILSTRIMIKQAMKKLMPSQQVLQRIYNARQLALKLIANVTYGYTAAGFSGRMPCAELADSIVQCGRRTLETAISFVNAQPKWNARVVYGDTDSMFVYLKGRSVEEAFKIGNEIASAITAMNPNPVALKLEKVYSPCFLLTKKRYVGYSYESPDQKTPTFDAKGIETVRRDTCPAVAKILEKSLRMFFEQQDISKVKLYLRRQWTRILSGKVSLQDFIFAKEVRLGTYSVNASSLPPAAIVASKATKADPRAEPHYAERIPYVIIHGEPGARLVDMVVDPLDLLEINSPYRLNDIYYITKQIIPALQRVLGLVGADLKQWFSEIPRPARPTLAKCHSFAYSSRSINDLDYNKQGGYSKRAKRNRIDNYYLSKHCTVCGKLVKSSAYICDQCSKKGPIVAAAIIGKTSKLEREIQHLSAICRHCGGGDWIIESGVKCNSLACSVFYERRKVQKELQVLSAVAAEAGFYPRCMIEWF